jgi:hypothetical protein
MTSRSEVGGFLTSVTNCDEGGNWGIHNGTSQRRQKHSVHHGYVGNYPKDLVFF